MPKLWSIVPIYSLKGPEFIQAVNLLDCTKMEATFHFQRLEFFHQCDYFAPSSTIQGENFGRARKLTE